MSYSSNYSNSAFFYISYLSIFLVSHNNIMSPFFLFSNEFKVITLSAYQSELSVFSRWAFVGLILQNITAWHFPKKQSLRTYVSLLPLKGICLLPASIAHIHSFRARRDLLISAPSLYVYLEDNLTSLPRSLPAKSIKQILLISLRFSADIKEIYKIAWDQEECSF